MGIGILRYTAGVMGFLNFTKQYNNLLYSQNLFEGGLEIWSKKLLYSQNQFTIRISLRLKLVYDL